MNFITWRKHDLLCFFHGRNDQWAACGWLCDNGGVWNWGGKGECSFCFTVALVELGVSFAWRVGKNEIGELMLLPNVIKVVANCCVPACAEGRLHPGKWYNCCHKFVTKGEGIPLACQGELNSRAGRSASLASYDLCNCSKHSQILNLEIGFMFCSLRCAYEKPFKYIPNITAFFQQKILDKMAEDYRQKKEA